ncbi:MAG: non-canonical purine NTP pyrophosphatase [Acidobacteria bacterium]|nr:non-canonical purine NTP pyrophosphatase [Acidobacteriota bacterium]
MGTRVQRLLIATTNRDKLAEIRRVLGDAAPELITLRDRPAVEEPEETGASFEENARLKALYYNQTLASETADAEYTLAEDSGLEIDALDGAPGIHSARFVRPDASYLEKFAEIFRRLAGMPDAPRTARFVCAVAVVHKGQVVFETRGTIEGEIAEAPRGTGGFGYDPVFYYPPYGLTLGEVSAEQKIAVAHRGVAIRSFAGWLRAGDVDGAKQKKRETHE